MAELGMVGLGLLGGALAERFLRAGLALAGFDLDPARREELRARGGRPVGSLAELRPCPRLVLCLPTTEVVEAVVAELLPAPGTVVVDTTTGDPRRTAALGLDLSTKDIHYLDATVVGSSEQARAGEVLALVGGGRDVAEGCADLLSAFARQVFHVGPWGSGARMKLAVNLVLGLNRAALAEGLHFASACGLDPAQALEVLRAGAAYSRVMDAKGPKMLARDFAPAARLSQHLKDVRLILAEACRAGAAVPLSALHRELLEAVEAAGFGGEDNAAVLRAFELLAGRQEAAVTRPAARSATATRARPGPGPS